MTESILTARIPVPEQLLRELSRDLLRVVPHFVEQDEARGVKQLQDILSPLLETADVADLSPSHRTAACNALCAVIDSCHSTNVGYVRDAILDDAIWLRLLDIYLLRSDNAKGKSTRQMLLVLTNVILKNPERSSRTRRLRDNASSIFLQIICRRQDRVKVKAALQGLAHFLQKDVVSIPELAHLYGKLLPEEALYSQPLIDLNQDLFGSFLSWIVHHDTALSAGHLLKAYLGKLRAGYSYHKSSYESEVTLPLWVQPVVSMLNSWQDRIQEFKTHVFPYCFLPNIDEYLQFLSYLHFGRHVSIHHKLPGQLDVYANHETQLSDSEEFSILLAAIETGKELGIVKDVEGHTRTKIDIYAGALHLPDNIFGGWLFSPKPNVRLAGLFLSIYSTAVTRPFTSGVLRSLKRNLVHLHTDTDANFRKEVLNQTQRLFDRLRGSTAIMAKAEGRKLGPDVKRIAFSTYRAGSGRHILLTSSLGAQAESLEFIIWYLHFIEWEMRSTASYQRRTTALKTLSIVLRSGLDSSVPHRHLSKSAQGQLNWAHGIRMCSPLLIRLLLDLVFDPFDDIRNASIALLEISFDSLSADEKLSALSNMPRFLERAEETMLRTGRADQADGLARAYALLFTQCTEQLPVSLRVDDSGLWSKQGIVGRLIIQLESTLDAATKDLSLAVDGRPVHGIFAALRYIFDQDSFYPSLSHTTSTKLQIWQLVHHHICTSFETLWLSIRDVLCADAPEGHVPEELEEESLDTKEILSYSWRGLKEASVLIRTIINKAPIGNDEASFITPEKFESLGRLCFTQLIDLRHRGAHSTVAQTFAAFCRRSVITENQILRGLPETWYQDTLLSIQDKATSITRRSAGIPSLMTGILAAEPQPGGKLFQRAMRDLIAEASVEAPSANIEESRLPQVHALNCIKEFFMSSKLSVASEVCIGDALDLAARLLNSNVWPIRNCSLMLFKALIERLLGSDEAQDWQEQDRTKTSRFSYNDYPMLVGILVGLLDPTGPLEKSMAVRDTNSPMDLHGAEGVFPALQIVRQAMPPETHRKTIIGLVRNLLGSPHWHLREMAARTFVSLHLQNEYFDTILSLLSALTGSHNTQHGMLLSLKYMLRKYLNTSQGPSKFLDAILLKLSEHSMPADFRSACPFTKSAFFDIVNICGLYVLRWHPSSPTWKNLLDLLPVVVNDGHSRTQGGSLLHGSSGNCCLIDQAISLSRDEENGTPTATHGVLGVPLQSLAYTDPDTCSSLLDTIAEIMRHTKPRSVANSVFLSYIRYFALHSDDREVKAKGQTMLAASLADAELNAHFFANMQKADTCKSLDDLEAQCFEGSSSNVQSALRLMAYFLDHAFQNYHDIRQRVYQCIAPYIHILRLTILDTNPFDLRYAAVQSLSALNHIWTSDINTKPASTLILGLSLVLHDLLNDDDDEIRDLAAHTTTNLLRAQNFRPGIKDAVPVVATQRLFTFLATRFTNSPFLAKESLRRLLNAPFSKQLFTRSFAHMLAQERKEDNALFAQEKQNLYRDETVDVISWTKLLKTLSPQTIRATHISGLTTWVLDGLVVLTETARGEIDGPLGWTNCKPEVFALGMRIFCAAELVLVWNKSEGWRVRRALRGFADVGAEREVHGLWMERVERVLGDSVMEVVRDVAGRLAVARVG